MFRLRCTLRVTRLEEATAPFKVRFERIAHRPGRGRPAHLPDDVWDLDLIAETTTALMNFVESGYDHFDDDYEDRIERF